MKQIPLTQGKIAFVDDIFYEPLRRQGTWHAERQGRTWYAARTQTMPDGRRQTIYMHRVVWKLAKDEEVAARLYDQAARELYGEFACLNFQGPT